MSFDLSSTTSSDEGSVVDISALLPDKKETEEWTSSQNRPAEPSSSVEDEQATENQYEASKRESNSQLKKNNTKSTKKVPETIDKEAKNNSRTIRIVMGESVKTWQRQRNLNRTDKSLEPNARYIMIRSSDSPTNGKVNQAYSLQKIDFEKSRLDVQKSMGGKNARVDIIETNEDKEKRHSTKVCKPSSSAAFVDCVAIWDPQTQVYTLEIPELIATSDARLVSPPDENDQNTKKRQRIGSDLIPNRKQRRS